MQPDDPTIIRDDDLLPDRLRGGVVAIGNFDGVHRGHRAVLGRALDIASATGAPALALTFEPHPRTFFRPDRPVFRLTPADVKARLIASLGFDATIEMAFDATRAGQAAEAFVTDVLVGRLGVGAVAVGHDFHFGKARAGTPALLAELGERLGFNVAVVSPAGDANAVFSSSRVRDLLAEGRVGEAAEILGYRWYVRGEVVPGARRGRNLGFPTANMRLADNCGLRHGVYAVRLRQGGVTRKGVASFGRRPQFDNGAPLMETHVFDFRGDLYGQTVEVEPVAFLRPEARFPAVDALVAQMHVDADKARAVLARETA